MTRARPSHRSPAAGERRDPRAQAFDNVLPDRTCDEVDDGDPREAARDRDDWLRDQVPPHHG